MNKSSQTTTRERRLSYEKYLIHIDRGERWTLLENIQQDEINYNKVS